MLAVGSLLALWFCGLPWCLPLFRFADLSGLFCIWFVLSFRGLFVAVGDFIGL